MESTAPAILELGLLLLAAVAAGWLARRFGLPAVVGYLVVGLSVSPFTPGYIADRERLQLLADLGVVLLLFEVGIEVDPIQIRRENLRLVMAVPVQVLLTMATSTVVLVGLGIEWLTAAVLGLCLALSSSVVIANMTRSAHRTTDKPTETALLGWSVMQDLAGVTLAAVLLSGVGVNGRGLALTILGLAAFAALALAVASVLPRILRALAGQSDFFLIVSVATGLTLAGAGAVAFGVPLALAAFVGGLAVAESPESAEARVRLAPFRDLLAVLFFVAIGTLVDPGALVRGLGWMAVFLALIAIAKVVPAFALVRLAKMGSRPLQTAVGLGQIGEFSFVLASALVQAGSLGDEVYAALLATLAVSIAASSVAVRLAASAPSVAAAQSPLPSGERGSRP
jgi:CPA2 family monovalent cation:H+ antiporter-2